MFIVVKPIQQIAQMVVLVAAHKQALSHIVCCMGAVQREDRRVVSAPCAVVTGVRVNTQHNIVNSICNIKGSFYLFKTKNDFNSAISLVHNFISGSDGVSKILGIAANFLSRIMCSKIASGILPSPSGAWRSFFDAQIVCELLT